MSQHETTNRICEAAIRLAADKGVMAMTIENVAREADLSKGGVMYHFPTKERLIQGTVEYFGARVESSLLKKIADDPEPRFRWARAMLSLCFPDPARLTQGATHAIEAGEMSADVIDRFMLSILAAAVNNPGVLGPMRDLGLRIRKRLLDDPEEGMEQLLVWLAVDGLFLWQFVGMIQRDDPLFAMLHDVLFKKVAVGKHQPRIETSAEISLKAGTTASESAAESVGSVDGLLAEKNEVAL